MSRLWPRAQYAEDQPYPRAILTTHVLTRGLQAGALTSASIATVRYMLRKPPNSSSLTTALLRSSGRGTVIGTGLISIALVARMWGCEDIEWKDRSWRLLQNKGQLECDDWMVAWMGAGLVGGALSRGAKGMVGGLGLGSVLSVLGYMGWRYGVKGGKFKEDDL